MAPRQPDETAPLMAREGSRSSSLDEEEAAAIPPPARTEPDVDSNLMRRAGRILAFGVVATVIILLGLVGQFGGAAVARVELGTPHDGMAVGNVVHLPDGNLAHRATRTSSAADVGALSPEELPLAARTARATAHCDIVLFSAAYFGADAALDDPRSRHHRALGNRTCAVLVVGPGTAEALAHHCSVAPWTVVADESATARDRPRRASKRVKLSASLYFPTAAFTLFVDWKYALLQTPEWFLERTAFRAPSRVSLFAHPCSAATSAALQGPFAATCARPRRPGEAWEAWGPA